MQVVRVCMDGHHDLIFGLASGSVSASAFGRGVHRTPAPPKFLRLLSYNFIAKSSFAVPVYREGGFLLNVRFLILVHEEKMRAGADNSWFYLSYGLSIFIQCPFSGTQYVL